jgi:hypothetical protein
MNNNTGDTNMETKKYAIVEMFGDAFGDKNLRVVWDGDVSELDEAIRVAKRQTKERWTRVLIAVSIDSVEEVYRKRGFSVEFPAQIIANVQRNLSKLGA